MSVNWDGVVQLGVLSAEAEHERQELSNAAKSYDWTRTLALLRKRPGLVNCVRPGGRSWFAALHQAAHGGAPVHIARELIELGAWRTLRDAQGKRPVDIALLRGHDHLLPVLTPTLANRVPADILASIQSGFHEVIRGRAAEFSIRHALRLPELEPLLELPKQEIWFPVPGMYGGFRYQLDHEGHDAVLVATSWCRVVGGSGHKHEITAGGSWLVDEDFV